MSSSFQADFFLGARLSRLRQFLAAVEPLRHASTLEPPPFARALLGDALKAIRELSEAADFSRALRDLERRNPNPHAGHVRCRERLPAHATQKTKNRDPESAYLPRSVGHSRLVPVEYPSALSMLRQDLEQQPNHPGVPEAIAQIYERSGRADWAEIENARTFALAWAGCSSPSSECDFASGRPRLLTLRGAGSKRKGGGSLRRRANAGTDICKQTDMARPKDRNWMVISAVG